MKNYLPTDKIIPHNNTIEKIHWTALFSFSISLKNSKIFKLKSSESKSIFQILVKTWQSGLGAAAVD